MEHNGGLSAELVTACEQVAEDVISWRHHLHQYPELSNREEKTAAFIADKLEEFGVDSITTDVSGHGVVAIIRGGADGDGESDAPRRSVLLRADIDALPVKEDTDLEFRSEEVDKDYPGGPFPVAHACGHDAHTAMLLGAARVLADARADLPGDVVLVFQPAEEGAPVDEEGGAATMIAEDLFDDLDPQPTMAFGMHVVPAPAGWICYSTGVQNAASELISITIKGRQVHGSTPWEGVDPLPAAAEIITAIGQIYRQVDAKNPFTVSIGHVEDTGRFNIVGGQVRLTGTARCVDDVVMDHVNGLIERLVDGVAAAYGCSAEVEFAQQVPPVINSPEWMEACVPLFEQVLEALGTSGDGQAQVAEVPLSLGYDDMSVFMNRFGGVYALLGVQEVAFDDAGNPVPAEGGRGMVPNHNPSFYVVDDALVTGVALHVAVARAHLAGQLEPGESDEKAEA
ncbi:M20 metallopeptidase family protein [Corynebacterium uberis]|nr:MULTISPECIES: M20 family metallopeptidase [Corynebacterium]MCZ9310250.1 M20 family metallopeptidase [Corynebacterium sp. c6VSa_13]UDL74815.1 M20 family metallopeptidase [Corynebacterium uberis]UDL76996.1 M20 family metallopeptidase [Corynebacterium uberis]UDL77607.1 M20 family metallopeptidase [Corynebacterium uberis]UDL81412.1 M20 family metallopeptidase [Corynebacterium uberis]